MPFARHEVVFPILFLLPQAMWVVQLSLLLLLPPLLLLLLVGVE